MKMRSALQPAISVAIAGAAIMFTYPEAQTTVTLPAIQDLEDDNRTRIFSVAWADDSQEPSMDQLQWYSLHLMFGGHDASNSQVVSEDSGEQRFSGYIYTGFITVQPAKLEAIEHGYYIQMVAHADPEGKYDETIIFYSERFSLEGVWGYAPSEHAKAASVPGNYRGPPTKSYLDPPLPTWTPPWVMSEEAKAKWIGGSVGGVLGLVLIALVLWVAWRRRRKAKARAELHQQEHELPGDEKGRLEMGADSSGKTSEIGEHRAELATDWTGWEAPALLEVELSRPSTTQ